MSRMPRFLRRNTTTIYHVISRSALDGFPMGEEEKDVLLEVIKRYSRLFFVDILGFAIMGNHMHLVCRVYPEGSVADEEIHRRFKEFFGQDKVLSEADLEYYRKRWTSLSEFVKDIKQAFSRYYNKKRNRKGYFWGDRFKSLVVQEGRTLVNLLAYIDLNPIRAGIVRRPEEYRWCSLGYHIQTGNKDQLLDVDFGLKEWGEDDARGIVRAYREFVYETGAADRDQRAEVSGQTEKGKRGIDPKIVDRERRRKYQISRADRFRYRSRYFTDAGVIGSKAFVSEVFDQVKHLLRSKDERTFTPVGGMDGVYSMKRLGV